MAAINCPSIPLGMISPQAIHIPQRHIHLSKPRQRNSTPTLIFSSAVAGGVEALATYPFEYAKTVVQLQAATGHRHNPFSIIWNVARHDGFATIYTGCSTLVAGTALKVSVRFASFDYFRTRLMDHSGMLTPIRGVLAGSLAGLTESIVAVTPTERLKTLLIERVQLGAQSLRGSVCTCRTDFRNCSQTFRGLYTGLIPTVLKQGSTQGVKMGSYNVIKEASRRNDVPQNGFTTFTTGALAGVITVYVTQPLDTVKTLAQSASGAGTIKTVRDLVLRAGMKGLWSGSTSRVGRLAFSSSILYTMYEKVATGLEKSLEHELLVFTQESRC